MTDITFAEPRLLWLLTLPAALFVVWIWRAVRRQGDARRLARHHVVPVRERFRRLGELAFWLAAVGGSATLVLAAAGPMASTIVPQRAGLDVVVLQDGSASMHVSDVTRASADGPISNRWQRSMRFLRELGDAISWNDDRLAMVAFAHVATPQIRLTRDPNTLFFFLDHLYARPPFRLEDDTTWDTNLEEAVGWGLRVVEKDEEIHGRSGSAAVFVMLSDGEAWSGEVAKAIARVVERGITLHVVGVGTLGGGELPAVRTTSGEVFSSPGASRLERASLQRIAAAGRGRYFELDRDGDRHIANTIVADGRRLVPAVALRNTAEPLYWWFLGAAALIGLFGLFGLVRRTELAIVLAGSVISAALIAPLLW